MSGEKECPSKSNDGRNKKPLPSYQDISQQVRGKVIEIFPQKNASSFRRVMFPSQLDIHKIAVLDVLCLDFIRETRCFDEIILVEVREDQLLPIYDFSLRNKNEPSIILDDFKDIANIGKNLNLGEWRYISGAEGASFDMVGKISHRLLLCVNNTGLSIDELEKKYKFWIFEEVKPIIERTIFQMKMILKK